MPVPVPVYSKPSAHLVIKHNRSQTVDTDYVRHSVFKHLTDSLPLPPAGPPPAFATREEWISSLPSWRRNKPRRIWEDDTRSWSESGKQSFRRGLAAADNATAIKGGHAQARIPPISTLIAGANFGTPMSVYGSSEEEMEDDTCDMDGILEWRDEDVAQLTDEDDDMAAEHASDYAIEKERVDNPFAGWKNFYRYDPVNGNYSPPLEETSPSNDRDSSPIGPATPFAEYIDRAVAEVPAVVNEHMRADTVPYCADECCGAQCYECQQQQYRPVQQVVQQAHVPDPVVTPSASAAYKRLAEPLSEWVANFVWRVCTTGYSLSSSYAEPSAFAKHYPLQPPGHLARSTHSVFLATLLQPSAILLALSYIVRLPIFFGPVGLCEAHVKEMRFRAELLGDAHMAYDREKFEATAPFRLIVLGCMLANKWLDDHTFSNKTWHTISNIDVHSLNKLESLALDLFNHDLSIKPSSWNSWLKQLHAHHVTVTSPSFPQPISRPSSSPHTIIRKALESLMEATDVCESNPEPVFYSFDDRKKETFEREQACADVDVLEIDLDEDGPLREEYLPRRRTSGASRTTHPHEESSDKSLPPPAKWSPSADEPLIPPATRLHTQYVAPQPIARSHVAALAPVPPAPFQQALDMTRRIWPADEQVSRYVPPMHMPLYAPPPPYHGYEYTYPPPPPPPNVHSRAQSLTFNPSAVGQHSHYRSYSQTRYDGAFGDYRYAEHRYVAPVPAVPHWSTRFGCAVYQPVYESGFHSRPLLKV